MPAIITEMSPREKEIFSLCENVSSASHDRSRKVGAVIVDEKGAILSTGYNSFPRNVSIIEEKRHSRESGEKYLWTEHAERNAIYYAARNGISLDRCYMYCTLFPCADCARALIQSGIIELNTYAYPQNDAFFSRSFVVANEMLREGGVRVRLFADWAAKTAVINSNISSFD